MVEQGDSMLSSPSSQSERRLGQLASWARSGRAAGRQWPPAWPRGGTWPASSSSSSSAGAGRRRRPWRPRRRHLLLLLLLPWVVAWRPRRGRRCWHHHPAPAGRRRRCRCATSCPAGPRRSGRTKGRPGCATTPATETGTTTKTWSRLSIDRAVMPR